MPARKRVREALRRVERALAQERAEALEAFARAEREANFLHDYWWRDHESGGRRDRCYPDDDCYFYCPHDPPWQAVEEINAYLNRGGSQ